MPSPFASARWVPRACSSSLGAYRVAAKEDVGTVLEVVEATKLMYPDAGSNAFSVDVIQSNCREHQVVQVIKGCPICLPNE